MPEIFYLSREGIQHPFSVVGLFVDGEPLALEIRDGGVSVHRGAVARRWIETIRLRAIPDLIPNLDRVEVLEVPEKVVTDLLELLKAYESSQRRLVQEAQSIFVSAKQKEYIKLHVAGGRDRRLEQELTNSLGPPSPGGWFFSGKFFSYVIPRTLEQELLGVLRRIYQGKYLFQRGTVWNIVDEQIQDSVEL
jgi:hypothetical protein